MPEQSTQSIVIDADPGEIMSVIADFANYPTWAASVKSAVVLEPAEPQSGVRARRVALTLDAGIVRDQYELVYDWTGDERVEWNLVAGQMMKAQHGSYTIRSMAPGRSEVTYSLSVDLNIPMLGLLKRKAERVVMDTALKELKRRVESLRVA